MLLQCFIVCANPWIHSCFDPKLTKILHSLCAMQSKPGWQPHRHAHRADHFRALCRDVADGACDSAPARPWCRDFAAVVALVDEAARRRRRKHPRLLRQRRFILPCRRQHALAAGRKGRHCALRRPRRRAPHLLAVRPQARRLQPLHLDGRRGRQSQISPAVVGGPELLCATRDGAPGHSHAPQRQRLCEHTPPRLAAGAEVVGGRDGGCAGCLLDAGREMATFMGVARSWTPTGPLHSGRAALQNHDCRQSIKQSRCFAGVGHKDLPTKPFVKTLRRGRSQPWCCNTTNRLVEKESHIHTPGHNCTSRHITSMFTGEHRRQHLTTNHCLRYGKSNWIHPEMAKQCTHFYVRRR